MGEGKRWIVVFGLVRVLRFQTWGLEKYAVLLKEGKIKAVRSTNQTFILTINVV